MNFMKLSIASLLTSAAFGQDCNYANAAFPVDVCLSYTSSYDQLYSCNGTDTIVLDWYTSGECGMTGTMPTTTYTYTISSWGGVCDQSKNCGYLLQTCDGELESSYVTDTCFQVTASTSLLYTCSGSKLTITGYSDGECKKKSGSATTDLVDEESTYGYTNCVYTCESAGGSSGNMLTTGIAFVAAFASLYKLF